MLGSSIHFPIPKKTIPFSYSESLQGQLQIASVLFLFLEGDYCLYQCFETPQCFQSFNYRFNSFIASNGMQIASRNSPFILSPKVIFLHGGYASFNLKPSLFQMPESTFDLMVSEFRVAIFELFQSFPR